MTTRFRHLPVLTVVALSGCTRSGPAVQPQPVADEPKRVVGTSTAGWATAENPQYTIWAKFKPGTTVKHRSVTASEGGKTVSLITYRLLEVTDAEVVVEMQNTTDRYDGYHKENPPEKVRNARLFQLPPGKTVEDYNKPTTANAEGQETVSMAGKEYKTTWYKSSDSTEAGKMQVQIWYADDMPGRLVKSVADAPALRTTTTVEVIEVVVPETGTAK